MKKIKSKSPNRDLIVNFLNHELKISSIDDSSRNGLQVEGTKIIRRIGLAVDACLEAYEAAAAEGCQMVLAHHGMIWGGIPYVTRAAYRQLKFLFDNDINLYAAHLPLDLHPVYGNNAQIAGLLGVIKRKPFGSYKGTMIGCEGMLTKPMRLAALSSRLAEKLGGTNVVLPFGKKELKRVAIVSGGGGEIIEEAIAKGIDCYVTGEPKHSHHHLAQEAGLNVIYCGHYHSEKPGVMAIGKLLTNKFGIECRFLDIPTRV